MLDDDQGIPAVKAGKRCGVQWSQWMDDWFTSWSPRNSNNLAEGPWDHWVELALKILQDPMTAKVRPEAQAAVKNVQTKGFYGQVNIYLSDEDLAERFKRSAS